MKWEELWDLGKAGDAGTWKCQEQSELLAIGDYCGNSRSCWIQTLCLLPLSERWPTWRHLGHEVESVEVARAYHGKVSSVQCGDLGDSEAFANSDDGRVDQS